MSAQTAVAGPGQLAAEQDGDGGVDWGAHDSNNAWGPFPGRKQTAGRGEVLAAVQAMIHADTAIYIIIGSTEVYSKGNQIMLGRTFCWAPC